MTWMKLEMTPTEAQGQYEEIQEAFFTAFVAAGLPKGAAMYESGISSSENAFYFSPKTASFLSTVLGKREAQPCSPPPDGTLTLLVNNAAK